MMHLSRIVSSIILLSLPLLSCHRLTDEERLRAFIATYGEQMEPLLKSGRLAAWNACATGEKKYYEELASLDLRIRTIQSSQSDFAILRELLQKRSVRDSLLQRELIVLYNSFAPNQVDTVLLREMTDKQSEVVRIFNTTRGILGGVAMSDNELTEILARDHNQEKRRAAWEALKQVGKKVSPMLIDLARLRNQMARTLGYENYYAMMLDMDEQDPAEVSKVFDELAELTEVPFQAMKRALDTQRAKLFGITPARLRPWHYEDPFFQEPPSVEGVDLDLLVRGKSVESVIREFFDGMNLPVDGILSRSDLLPRPGKYQLAFSTDIDRRGDIRTMCNLSDNTQGFADLLHELGHCVYSSNIDPDLPFLLRNCAHSLIGEAIAQLFQSQVRNADWINTMVGMGKYDLASIRKAGEAQERMGGLIFSRWSQVMMRFEWALYQNPDQDLNTLWWDLVEKYQGMSRPDGRNEPDWAAKIHFATSPCYYHNYILGRLVTSQILNALNRKVRQIDQTVQFSFAGDTAVGGYLKTNIFAPGARLHWNDLLKHATGEGLTAKYFAAQFCGKE